MLAGRPGGSAGGERTRAAGVVGAGGPGILVGSARTLEAGVEPGRRGLPWSIYFSVFPSFAQVNVLMYQKKIFFLDHLSRSSRQYSPFVSKSFHGGYLKIRI